MIKFFRRIRQKLLNDGRAGKYLLYALGEIILVVIGILIALQINTWNQERINEKIENEIIANLEDDFKINLKDIESYLTEFQVQANANKKLMSLIGSSREELALHNLDSIFFISMGAANIAFADNTLNNLIQTDRLGLIRSESLITLLNRWIALNKIRLDRVNKLDKWVNEFHLNYLLTKISFKEMDSYGNYEWSGKSKVKPDYYPLFQEVKFENSLENLLWYNQKVVERTVETRELIHQILDEIYAIQ